MLDSGEFNIRQSYVQSICTYIADLSAEKDYGEITDDKKTMYGLDDPTVITLSNGSENYVLYLGDADPTSTYYYVMTGNKNKIYAISYDTGDSLNADRIQLKDRYIVPYDTDEISNIKLLKDGETVFDFTYSEDNSTWSLPDKYSAFTVDQTDVSTMITYLVRTEAQEMFDENLQDLSTYGFDNPYAELVVTGLDGETHKFLFSYFGNNTATYTYVLFEDDNQAAAFYTGDVDFIEKTVTDFLVPELCSYSMYDVTGLDYSMDGSEASFTVDMDNNVITMDDISLTELGSDVLSDFTDFYNSIAYLQMEDIDIDASPSDDDPFLAVTFHFSESDDLLLELCKRDDDSFYAFINGKYTGAYVNKTSVTSKNAIKDFYESLIKSISKAQG
jgi:hypothetical protein